MQMQFAHAPVHTPEQVREIMEEAAKIADEMVDYGVDHLSAFEQACVLLGARASIALTPEALDLSALDLSNGGRR